MLNPIQNKKIVLGVTGSIACYKSIELASRLHQSGAIVDVILTDAARQFIAPLAFQSVTGRKAFVNDDLWSGEGHVVHIELGRHADLLTIVPATANILAKIAHGICDDLLSVTVLASDCPILIAPAMDAGMYSRKVTQENVQILKKRGAHFVGPVAGHLASGLIGVGRMEDPDGIYGHIRTMLSAAGPLQGRKVVVTAGPTQESIDPVRFITNHSSGKQGYAIAQAAQDAGAQVTLISGPTSLKAINGVNMVKIENVEELLNSVLEHTCDADILIMAAAPADFRPVNRSAQKVKKDIGFSKIDLEHTPDILQAVSKRKETSGFPRKTIGFAAESQNLLENARKKLLSKKLDVIIANDITADNAGFQSPTNQVTLLFSDGQQKTLPLMNKSDVAENIIQLCLDWFPIPG